MSTQRLRLVVHNKTINTNRTASLVHVGTHLQSAASDALDLNRTEVRDDSAPLGYSGRTDVERPRDIRGSLKVIQNGLLQHEDTFTIVKSRLQPGCQPKSLTSVSMDKLATIADRLSAAMTDAGVSPSQLSRSCGVSPAAVHKWQNGGKLSADSLAAAARALGVREEWLRTGKLPRERSGAEEESQIDRVVEILSGLQGPLAELAIAIERLNKAKQEPKKRQKL